MSRYLWLTVKVYPLGQLPSYYVLYRNGNKYCQRQKFKFNKYIIYKLDLELR